MRGWVSTALSPPTHPFVFFKKWTVTGTWNLTLRYHKTPQLGKYSMCYDTVWRREYLPTTYRQLTGFVALQYTRMLFPHLTRMLSASHSSESLLAWFHLSHPVFYCRLQAPKKIRLFTAAIWHIACGAGSIADLSSKLGGRCAKLAQTLVCVMCTGASSKYVVARLGDRRPTTA